MATMNVDDGSFSGFEIDLINEMKKYALEYDNITLEVNLLLAPITYTDAFDLVATDCNDIIEKNEPAKQGYDCTMFDMIIGDFFSNPTRYERADLTPSILQMYITANRRVGLDLNLADRNERDQQTQPTAPGFASEEDATSASSTTTTDSAAVVTTGTVYSTLNEVDRNGGTICVPAGTYLKTVVEKKYQNANYVVCANYDECQLLVISGACDLYTGVNTQLQYHVLQQPKPQRIQTTRDIIQPNYFVWPISYKVDESIRYYINRWIYLAVQTTFVDQLFTKYFEFETCPLGYAGVNCTQPCNPNHGIADVNGVCICDSTKWSGEDCSIEILEDKHLIPKWQLNLGYVMFTWNVCMVVGCSIWLYCNQNLPYVKVAQPFFLGLILLGCFISTSTILALMQQDSDVDDDSNNDDTSTGVGYCMAIPWTYSIGFCITFGTLFAKIYRVHRIVLSSIEFRRTEITVASTVYWIGLVLCVDVTLLTIWTLHDPLKWERTITSTDKFGIPLSSTGTCTSEHWKVFVIIIGAFHFTIMCVACYICYVARKLPVAFNSGNHAAMAMLANLQILIVGLPVVALIGSDSTISFFIRSAMIFMNDLVVVVIIFGDLMFRVHGRLDGASSFFDSADSLTTPRNSFGINSAYPKQGQSGRISGSGGGKEGERGGVRRSARLSDNSTGNLGTRAEMMNAMVQQSMREYVMRRRKSKILRDNQKTLGRRGSAFDYEEAAQPFTAGEQLAQQVVASLFSNVDHDDSDNDEQKIYGGDKDDEMDPRSRFSASIKSHRPSLQSSLSTLQKSLSDLFQLIANDDSTFEEGADEEDDNTRPSVPRRGAVIGSRFQQPSPNADGISGILQRNDGIGVMPALIEDSYHSDSGFDNHNGSSLSSRRIQHPNTTDVTTASLDIESNQSSTKEEEEEAMASVAAANVDLVADNESIGDDETSSSGSQATIDV